ncbi:MULTISPECIES: SDR family NAD(P)-dependent oxidoreductase [Paraburkholderia]|uniref:SDR family NAD(P)-dependent oxidoreductase n=1 Tax=Paraburkholderia TaxID=1822464 RepID=UPI0038B920BF
MNNVGGTRVYVQGSAPIPDEEWLDSLDINFLVAVRLTNAVLPSLKNPKAGVFINITSSEATPPPAPLRHYLSAQAALNGRRQQISNALLQGMQNTVFRNFQVRRIFGCTSPLIRSAVHNSVAFRKPWSAFW